MTSRHKSPRLARLKMSRQLVHYPITKRRVVQSIVFSIACLMALRCPAQQFDFPSVAVEDSAMLSKSMTSLAGAVIEVYRDDDREKYLDNLFRLQIVAGRYGEATKTLNDLRVLGAKSASPQAQANNVQYEIFARAKAMQGEDTLSFDEAFQRAFREMFVHLDDRSSALVMRALSIVDPSSMQRDFRDALERQKGKNVILLPDALELIRAFQVADTYHAFNPLIPALIAEDDERRYVIDKDVPVKTPEGATICTTVVRPRPPLGHLPTLLNFTIYADPNKVMGEARRTASNGYAGVEGLTRGKGCSPEKAIPYEHDGRDAAAVIEWIARQPWSDGRVGMYGGSYEGFTQWAAAKHIPKALKALMPCVPVGPGIDVPMDGNVFMNFVYPWPFYTTNNKTLDDSTYNDRKRWDQLNRNWYVSGQAYRNLEKIDGTPNPIFNRWLDHPTYDAYWQGMIPYKKEFARIKIPVLATAGYFGGGPGAAVYYLMQHHKYRPEAEHYLVIGPYDHVRGHRGTIGVLGGATKVLAGYELDPVAQLDIGELRYQWFDYVFKGAPKPALLKDKVNYQVMGANVWKHAPSVAAMSNRTLRLHLSAERSRDHYRLTESKPADDRFVAQTIDFTDRSDVDRILPRDDIVAKVIDIPNSIEFVGEPFTKSIEMSGLFSGRLSLITNKKDFDFNIALYELTSKDEYILLSTYQTRASHVGDIIHPRLLTPGKRQRLDFKSVRLTSRQLQAGSRLVVVFGVIKQPDLQINYGTAGKDVSDETIADVKEPLTIKWFGDSFIDIPVGR